MKNFILIPLCLLLSLGAYSQKKKHGGAKGGGSTPNWLSLEFRGGAGTGYLLHSSSMKDKQITTNMANLSYAFGGRFGYTKGERFGFSVEALYQTTKQGFEYRPEFGIMDPSIYRKTIKVSSVDITPMFRVTGTYGFIFELGPSFSLVQNVEETNIPDLNALFDTPRTAEHFTDLEYGITLGIGTSLVRVSTFELNFTVRVNAGISDLMKDENIIPDDGYYNNLLNNPSYASSYETYTKTMPVTGQMMLGINYFFAVTNHASCGKNKIRFFPKI